MAWFPPRYSPIQQRSLRSFAGEFPTPPQYGPLSEGMLRPCLYPARGRPRVERNDSSPGNHERCPAGLTGAGDGPAVESC